MLLFVNTTDKLQAVTSAATAVDVVCTYMDASNAAPPVVGGSTSGRQLTAISTATTTDILAAPASSTLRTLRTCSIRNKDTATSNDVTVRYNANGTTYEVVKVTLLAGQTLEYASELGWYTIGGSTPSRFNFSYTSTNPFTSDTYLPGSNVLIPANVTANSLYRCVISVAKTAAGTATPVLTVRVGTAASTADTSRASFTFASGTAAADDGNYELLIQFATVGSGTSATIGGVAILNSALATTGLSNLTKSVVAAAGTGFDSTAGNIYIGVSYNAGASASHTVDWCMSQLTVA